MDPLLIFAVCAIYVAWLCLPAIAVLVLGYVGHALAFAAQSAWRALFPRAARGRVLTRPAWPYRNPPPEAQRYADRARR